MVFTLDSPGYNPIPTPPPEFKSGFVGIVGRPNVGKSTLMNGLVGQKVAITSPTAQTTRNRLRGILSTEQAQIIFVDTPGIHKPHHELGKILVKNARLAIEAVDLTLFVVDGSVAAGRGDQFVADLLAQSPNPVIVGVNKVDLQSTQADSLNGSYTDLAAAYNWPLVKFSALQTNSLEPLLTQLMAHLPPGPYYYPPTWLPISPNGSLWES
jgi:GTP-binding protein Era